MIRILFLSSLLFTCSWAEPSAFSAGDLTVEEPYGLTENEKLLLKNIDTVKHLKRDKNILTSEVDTLNHRIDGVQSVVDGLSQNHQKTTNVMKGMLVSIDELENSVRKHAQQIDGLDQNITQLKNFFVELKTLQENNFLALENIVKRIDQTYVSRETFAALQKEITDLRTLITQEFEKLNKKKASPKISVAEMYKKGQEALKSKQYDEAKKAFEFTIKNSHKPAGSHFYLAEAYYGESNYPQAIANYKASYERYKKGSYNPVLFLHMAISLDKTGEKDKAQKFYEVLGTQYPSSSEYAQAKKYFGKN